MHEKKNAEKIGPVVLAILDGWGISRTSFGNALEQAKTPNIKRYRKIYPYTELIASGKYVGLPSGQPGNSEAGHINIGAGRIVDQDAVRINRKIKDGSFFKNPVFIEAFRHVKKNNSSLHLMGMLTLKRSGHSDPDHLRALLQLARKENVKKVFLHLFTDGRDAPQYAALKLIEALMRELQGEMIATITGRFYAMDRKKFWDRTKKTYEAMVLGKGVSAKSPQAAITESYNRKETDEFVPPYVLKHNGKVVATIRDHDSVIFFNFRSDRARQLSKAFVQKDFMKMNPGSFVRQKVLKDLNFVAMTDFGPDLDNVVTAFPSEPLNNTLTFALAGLRQLYISESEKYAHVNYFFNGGYPDPVAGEKRVKILSPNVNSYDQTPEMSSKEITKYVLQNIKRFDFIVLNYSNVDMVGHSGNFEATVQAAQCIDTELEKLRTSILEKNGIFIIVGDHGNGEAMIDPKTKEIITEHTTNPVPCILISRKKWRLRKGKIPISAVAPTILKLFRRPIPPQMKIQDLLI